MLTSISKLILLVSLLASRAGCDEHEHSYEDGEEVVLWMNTVGPYHNRQETYEYFSLPFCRGPKTSIGHYHETLGEALLGVELEFSGLDIDFKGDVQKTQYCEVELSEDKYQAFVYAVKSHYWYQMYIDDLPVWGIVGEIDEGGDGYYIWTHKKLDIGINGKQIVDVNLTSESKVKLVSGIKIPFSYEVKFHPSTIKFKDRFDKYLDPNFFQHRIHWFSIFNSFMMVIFLVGLVSMILMRTLRKDYARYSKEDDLDDMEKDLGDEYGWKQVHGDVFRPASNAMLFSALVGTGYHIAIVALCVITFAIIGELYTERGSLLSTAILAIVTICVTIVCTYFLLNAEDYRWQWTSFLAAGSTAGYVYLYSFYYFFFKTKMYGFFQTSFYFGYMALFSLALGIMCGTIGYAGTGLFVRKIYSTVKID